VKALVLGAQGQLGGELLRLLPEAGASAVRIEEADAVDALLARVRPEVVFNCAAYNAVDGAETEREAADAGNARGPGVLAEACARRGARLVHYSTNFVFDGTLDRPYLETDAPAPLSEYGRSKLLGERRVLAAMPDALVLRTAALYGGVRSFPSRMLERARAGAQVRVVGDQCVNPTWARDLARLSVELAPAGMAGIVHAVGAGCCRWDEFARAALAAFDCPAAVETIATEALAAAARRPRNGCLASTRIAPLRSWREGLAEWAGEAKTP
jgi:dTDP-4-dehydrorhamnose reductase